MRLRAVYVLAVVALLTASPAFAATITYDSALGGPGFFNGTGNPDGGFTIATEDGFLIALRAKQRQSATVLHSADEIYEVPTGSQPGVPTRAWWNYEFSIDVCFGIEDCDRVLDDFLPYSTLTVEDLVNGYTNTVTFPYWADNATWGSGVEHVAAYSTDTIVQNSQNPVFGDFPLALLLGYPGFNMNDDGYYRFTIDLRNANGASLLTNYMDVQVGDGAPVPEPATLMMLGAGLLGIAAVRKRKTSKQ